MLRSLFSGITGLRQHQTLMDVVSNNIANVNTTGFKSSTVVFEDTLSQLMRSAGAPTAIAGGVNPSQVGLGVQLGTIDTNFGQGSAQNTGKATDLMISGDGFFLVRNGSETNYTRAGAFTFDSNGSLVNPEGHVVQGWTRTNGTVNTDNPVGDIIIPTNTTVPPTASTKVTLGGNITMPTSTTMTLGATVYDGQGVAHTLSLVLTPTATTSPQSFNLDITDTSDPALAPVTGSTVAFTAAGAFDPTTSTVGPYPTITLTDGTAIAVDISSLTNFGGAKTMGVTNTDGATSGTLQQFQIGGDGSVLGIFTNGQKLTIARIALANFNNPEGLEKIGDSEFRTTYNSGLAQVGVPAGGGRGQLMGGTLEMSNVDLAREFTNLIVAQRGFQANSRVITTSDQMLQDLVDLKR
ncbi:MAG TPA: flagellar hook protein FlgE [Kineosporiaceae bacterium]